MKKALIAAFAALLPAWTAAVHAGTLVDLAVVNRATGEREASEVISTDFRRASSNPAEMISIHYDGVAKLIARGIIAPAPRAEPNPFPGFRSAPDPRS
jgi:hypothetical protein